MSVRSVLITGANRGIGLEFVKQFLALSTPPKHIFATCRNPSTATDLLEVSKANPTVEILSLDVKDYKSYPEIVQKLKSNEEVSQNGLNLLINNAGIAIWDKFEDVTRDSMIENFEVNAVCPLLFTKELFPLLKQASSRSNSLKMSCSRSAVINITSKMGSIVDNTSGNHYPYRTSKTALNMITKCLSVDLSSHKILALVLHPGWVRTEMGGPSGLIDAQTSVQGMMQVITKASDEHNGGFFAYDGKEIPW